VTHFSQCAGPVAPLTCPCLLDNSFKANLFFKENNSKIFSETPFYKIVSDSLFNYFLWSLRYKNNGQLPSSIVAPPMAPQLRPKPRPLSSFPFPFPFPLLPLSDELSMASHGAPTPAMAALPWRASHKLGFLSGMTKTDAYDLPLAILTLNFIQNEL
jgi:hypothetical protein